MHGNAFNLVMALNNDLVSECVDEALHWEVFLEVSRGVYIEEGARNCQNIQTSLANE